MRIKDMIRKHRRKIDLSIVDVNDEDTRTFFPLIEKPVGSVTYEHCLVEKLYGDVYIGTAERNYYVDSYHECCPYVNTFEPPQEARKLGISWDLGFAHPWSECLI